MTNHIQFDPAAMQLRLLDQRLLPGRKETLVCNSPADVISAIKTMAVRGAPAIGVAAAFGCVLAAWKLRNSHDWRADLAKTLGEIRVARPTAVNLAWAVNRMENTAAGADNINALITAWIGEAQAIQTEDIAICQKIGETGASLIGDGDTVLTHCNAGTLATAGHGTALGVIRSAFAQGKRINVIADETRPFLQGSRLTAWELAQDGIPVRIACDNACAHLMAGGHVQLAITGADRIAANGDSANKIGTLGVAIIAHYYDIPFYIAAPLSTIAPATPDGAAIPIESRPEAETLEFAGIRVAPENVGAYNFAFDVTPASLISGIITEKGILRPPYGPAIAELFKERP